ncbi:alpha/beta hydrolase, partial [Mycobacteroides abscessus]|uniref:alpha/beta hydrolase n=1 Tax=Mycobacteroides abscessus TaxID=36809 RepID=UPI0013F6622E
MFGHSYGSTTTSYAGHDGRLAGQIQTVTLLGSPGAGPHHTAESFRIGRENVFPPWRVGADGGSPPSSRQVWTPSRPRELTLLTTTRWRAPASIQFAANLSRISAASHRVTPSVSTSKCTERWTNVPAGSWGCALTSPRQAARCVWTMTPGMACRPIGEGWIQDGIRTTARLTASHGMLPIATALPLPMIGLTRMRA